jgi:hypothetical protein
LLQIRRKEFTDFSEESIANITGPSSKVTAWIGAIFQELLWNKIPRDVGPFLFALSNRAKAEYQLILLANHIGSACDGQKSTFYHVINDSSKFDDSIADAYFDYGVFDEHFPSHPSRKAASLLIYSNMRWLMLLVSSHLCNSWF